MVKNDISVNHIKGCRQEILKRLEEGLKRKAGESPGKVHKVLMAKSRKRHASSGKTQEYVAHVAIHPVMKSCHEILS